MRSLFIAATALIAPTAFAASPVPRSSVITDAFHGAMQTTIAIDAPAFHAIEPRLALAYSSSGGAGLAGVGWDLTGFSAIERASPGQGAPRYDSSDIFVLDGQELVACASGMVSPSCATGGTHAAKIESYERIAFSPASNTWTITRRDGIKRVYAPVYGATRGTFRWGIQSVQDTKGNRVDYAWACAAGDCYPSSVAYGPYRIALYREPRPDPRTFANGESIGTTRDRLRTILVEAVGSSPIRAYRLSYATAPATRRSQLVAVQQYGRDVAIDAAGAITGGTALPAMTFAYQPDPAAGSFVLVPAPAPTAPGTVEDVAWFKKRCAASSGSALWKSQADCPGSAWNAGGSSTRVFASGDGYMQFTDGSLAWWHGENIAGLSSNDALASGDDIDYGFRLVEDPETYAHTLYIVERGVRIAEVGEWTTSSVLRVAVENGHVMYRRDGVALLPPRPGTPTYPLRASAALRDPVSGIKNVQIAGALVDLAGWCVDGLRSQGDYNGDGRSDLLCKEGDTIRVRLGDGTGFGAPGIWLTGSLDRLGQGDFDGDGKTDIYGMDVSSGDFRVALSTGASFAAPASWTSNTVCRLYELQFRVTTGDFNGDGRSDVACQRTAGDASDGVWVGLSTGTRFVHARWLAACGLDHVAFAHDLDGDGRDDLACIDGAGAVDVNLSTGASFDGAALTGAYILAGHCDWNRWQAGDFNADGKGDFACANSGQVWLSVGRQLAAQPASSAFCPGEHEQLLTGDVDGDGLSDWICKHENLPAGDIEVRLGTGTGFAPATTWLASFCLGSVVAADLDGDRKTDLVCDEAIRPIARAGTAGAIPDLMTTWANGLGGTTAISYAPSSQFPATNNPPVVPVVVALATSDGRGGTSTSTFSYDGGLIDRQGRRYLGFAHQREVMPCDAAPCPKRDLYFAQDYGSASKEKRRELRDSRGRLMRVTIHELTTNGATIPYTSLETGTWEYTYDPALGRAEELFPPATRARRTFVFHDHDGFANERRTIEYGDFDVPGDERRVERYFYPNTLQYIVDRVGAESTMSGAADGVLLRQSITLYDGSSIWDQPPQQGYPTQVLFWHDASNSFVATQRAYDAAGNVVATTDETGLRTTTEYDAARLFAVRTTNPAGEVTLTAWDTVCGQRTLVTDPNAQQTRYDYDPLCRPRRVTRPLGGYETTSYVAFGSPADQRIEVRTPLPVPPTASGDLVVERVVARYFDGRGRMYRTSSSAPAGLAIEQTTSFDAAGNNATESAPYYTGETPRLTRFEYDALGRTLATVKPDGARFTTAYGQWLEEATDPHGHVTRSRFDGYGRLSAREQLADPVLVTAQAYDLLGDLVGMTDPAGNAWRWQFDSLGRTTAQQDPDAGLTTYERDAAGRLIGQTDARGQHIALGYTAGRLASKTTPDGSVSFAYSEPRQGYANVGRLTTMTDPAGAQRLDYDAEGHVVRTTRTLGGVDYALLRRYAPSGHLVGTTFPDGDTVGSDAAPLTYDRAGRLLAIPGVVGELLYDAAGAPRRQTNLNGTITHWQLNLDRGWLDRVLTSGPVTEQGFASGPTAVQDLTYTHDAAGLVTAVASPFAHESRRYQYDAFHRVLAARDNVNPGDDETYAYDAAGNLTQNSRVGAYSYPAPGSPRPHAPRSINGDPQSYDAAGNLILGSGRTLAWDAEGRAVQVGATGFVYDGAGARLVAGGSLTPVGEDYEIAGGVVTKYITSPIGLLAKRTAGTTYWFHLDAQRSLQAITDAAGQVVQRIAYRAYGDLLAMQSSHVEPHGYIGERRDADTALTYLHARYYDARLGLFLSPDPSLPSRPSVGTNRYAYALGSPTNLVDHSGLDAGDGTPMADYDAGSFSESITVWGTAGAMVLPPIIASLILADILGHQGGPTTSPEIAKDPPALTPNPQPAPAPPKQPEKPKQPDAPKRPCASGQPCPKEELRKPGGHSERCPGLGTAIMCGGAFVLETFIGDGWGLYCEEIGCGPGGPRPTDVHDIEGERPEAPRPQRTFIPETVK